MITVKLPPIDTGEILISDKSSIVLIGANGSGKTRMSTWIEYNNPEINIHRISAQKSLNMPSQVRPSEMQRSQENFLYGTSNDNKEWLRNNGKRHSRWGDNPDTHLLNDFNSLMEFLVTEEYEKTIEYRTKHKSGQIDFDNETRLEKIKRIWENVITNKVLKISAGKIEVSNKDETIPYYNSSQMSDGERAIFYFIGEVLAVPNNSLIIIDEPENHLHKSILIRLWNAIESEKKDCVFMYITHNLDFAISRSDSQLIWVKNMPQKDSWEYELLNDEFATDALKLEILGNRQKILLIEGTPDKSTDKKLYSRLFNDYNIIALESCNRVIGFTKAYRRLNYIHYDDVKGIIDRDRHSEDDIKKYNEDSLFCPEVAEIENLFLLPEVIEIVCNLQNKVEEYADILSNVKTKTFEFLTKELDAQTLLFVRQQLINDINKIINAKATSINEYKNNIASLQTSLNIDALYQEVKRELEEIVESKDYDKALKVINNKGLLPYTGLNSCFGWKKDFYIDYIIKLLDKSDSTSSRLAEVFRNYIKLS